MDASSATGVGGAASHDTTSLVCAIAGRCGGCPWFDRPIERQHQDKLDVLRALLFEHGRDATWFPVVGPTALGFRERLDLRFAGAEPLLGLLDAQGAVVDMATCPIATPEVERALAVLRDDLPPIERASLRLRAKAGAVGLWLDLPHVSLKSLLDERQWLERATARGWVVELGPKGRRYLDGLVAPTLLPWSETVVRTASLPLYTTVMGFSQPGAKVNRALVEALMAAVGETDAASALELGCGAGNLTLPLAAELDVVALELEIAPLERTLAHARTVVPEVASRIQPKQGSFHREADVPELVATAYHGHPVDLIVCDPPRSGLGAFLGGRGGGLAALSKRLRPRHLVYVSCHPEALAADTDKLVALGYRLMSLRGVDQFPWTPHAEWVARFERS